MPPTTVTAEVRYRQSLIYQFLHGRFPLIPDVARLARTGLAESKTLVPVPSKDSGFDPRVGGTVFDYAVRLALFDNNLYGTVAYKGIERIKAACARNAAQGNDPGCLVIGEAFEDDFIPLLIQARRNRKDLIRLALALAFFEPFGRGTPIDPACLPPSVECLLENYPQTQSADALALLELADDRLRFTDMRRVAHNPCLGNEDIGADADFVADRTLFELKCVQKPTDEWPNMIRQVLSYLLLNVSNRLGVNQVAIYMARQGVITEWTLRELIQETGGEYKNWRALQNEFAEVCVRSGAGLQFRFEAASVEKDPP